MDLPKAKDVLSCHPKHRTPRWISQKSAISLPRRLRLPKITNLPQMASPQLLPPTQHQPLIGRNKRDEKNRPLVSRQNNRQLPRPEHLNLQWMHPTMTSITAVPNLLHQLPTASIMRHLTTMKPIVMNPLKGRIYTTPTMTVIYMKERLDSPRTAF